MTRYTFEPIRVSGINQIAIKRGKAQIATLPASALDRAWEMCARLNGKRLVIWPNNNTPNED